MPILVAYATKYGATQQVAERIAETLHAAGLDAQVRPVQSTIDPAGYGAIVLGSAVYSGSWLQPAVEFVRRNREVLADRPVWLFSGGLKGTQRGLMGAVFRTQVEPKELAGFRNAIRPRDYRAFTGAIERGQFPDVQRFIFEILGGRYGDFRDWQEIQAWAEGIARQLRAAE